MLVEARQVGAAAGLQVLQDGRVHGEPGHRAGDVVGRAPHQPVVAVGERLERSHAAGEIVPVAALEPVEPEALAVLLASEEVAIGRIGFEFEQVGDGLRAVTECRMVGDVGDPFRADIDEAPVAHPLELFFSADQHDNLREVGSAGQVY